MFVHTKIKKNDGTLMTVLKFVAKFIICFDIVMIPIYFYKDWNMDIIVTMNLGAGGIETLFTTVITIANVIAKNHNKEDE